MTLPKDCRYTKDHEWIKIEGDTATVGVTDFAQSELGEIVFVELPQIGKALTAGGSFCVLESTKAASDVYSPIAGTVKEVNESVRADPTTINREAQGNGWLVKLTGFDPKAVESLMTSEQYAAHIGA